MLTSKLKIGQLDTRIVIEKNNISYHETTNEPIDSWEELSTVWAIRETNQTIGNINFESDQPVAIAFETFIIRYSDNVKDVSPVMRFYEKGQSDYYYITNTKKYKREGYILIKAENRDNQ